MYNFFKSLLIITIIVSVLFLIGLLWSFVYVGPFRESLSSVLKLGLLIPFVLLICFLGMNRHKDSDKFKLKPSFYYSFLLLAALGAVLTYFKVTQNNFGEDGNVSSVEPRNRDNLNALPKPHVAGATSGSNTTASNTTNLEASSSTKPKGTDSAIVPLKVVATGNNTAQASETTKGKQATEIAYEAVSKAYVYAEPSEATKKELFVEKQPQSLPLKPRDEKNGFVYVIIPSKGGTVTSGWLRKKDLKKVKVPLDYGKG
jgi:hypothetical protein